MYVLESAPLSEALRLSIAVFLHMFETLLPSSSLFLKFLLGPIGWQQTAPEWVKDEAPWAVQSPVCTQCGAATPSSEATHQTQASAASASIPGPHRHAVSDGISEDLRRSPPKAPSPPAAVNPSTGASSQSPV